MAGEPGSTPDEQSVVAAWRRIAGHNQVALARSDPAYPPLLASAGPTVRPLLVQLLQGNRDKNQYLLGPVIERVQEVVVSPDRQLAVLRVCEDNPDQKFYDLTTGAFLRDADPAPIGYNLDLVRQGESWLVNGLSRLEASAC